MMNFFDAQARARKNTVRLFVFMAVAVLAVVLAAYLLAAGALGLWESLLAARPGESFGPVAGLWRPRLFLGLLLGTALLVSGAAWRQWRALSGGGAVVARLLRARWVRPGTDDLMERRLLNVVEEMALASGMPMPVVFLLDGERAINAFAAGLKPSDAIIVVTRGAVEELSRDELQGVVGHEFSHILNGDMRLNVRLAALLAGLQCVGALGEAMLGDHSRKENKITARLDRHLEESAFLGLSFLFALVRIPAGLVVAAFGYAGWCAGRLFQAMISRQREFLADAASVQFTRNPSGIIGALKKIGMADGAVLASRPARRLRHFFFADPGAGWLQAWFATHPTWVARIHAINTGEAARIIGETLASGRLRVEGAAAFAGGGAVVAAAEAFTASAGPPGPRALERARALIGQIPVALRDAAGDPRHAPALVAGLLLAGDTRARRAQWDMLHLQSGIATDSVRRLEPDLLALPRAARLPLAQLAMPALRMLPGRRAAAIAAIVTRLAECDDRISLFEYALMRVIRHHLLETGGGGAAAAARRRGQPVRTTVGGQAVRTMAGDAGLVMAFLAWHGSGADTRDEAAARAAFAAAGQTGLAGRLVPVAWEQVSDAALDFASVDAALDRLAAAPVETKRRLLDAAARVVLADGKVVPGERDLLRAIADSLDCPVPLPEDTESATAKPS
jgi:Zn-dependent protease with chaperone function